MTALLDWVLDWEKHTYCVPLPHSERFQEAELMLSIKVRGPVFAGLEA